MREPSYFRFFKVELTNTIVVKEIVPNKNDHPMIGRTLLVEDSDISMVTYEGVGLFILVVGSLYSPRTLEPF